MDQTNQTQKRALRELQVTLSRAIQREWVKEINRLLPEIEATLRAAGGPVEVEISPTDAGERSSQRELPKSCASVLSKVGHNHSVSRRLRAILALTGNDG